MALTTALSGIQAAQKQIDTTSNNIANTGTAGFKSSRVLFSDLFSTSPWSVADLAVGTGVRTRAIQQDFSEASVMASGRPLDLSVQGPGFFAVAPYDSATGQTGTTLYTRTGDFGLSAEGVVVNSLGRAALGWPTSMTGAALGQTAATAGPIRVPFAMGVSQRTEQISLNVALPASSDQIGGQAAVPPAAPFDPADPSSWAVRTPVSLVGGDGAPQEAQVYFSRQALPTGADGSTVWRAHLAVQGRVLDSASADVSFDSAGELSTAMPLSFSAPDGGRLALDLTGTRVQGAGFRVQSVWADGRAPAAMTALNVDANGTIWANYGTGDPVAHGTLMLASFTNPDGLRQTGDTSFLATPASGAPVVGTAQSPGFGKVNSGGLEGSNVDLTLELVDLITAQRNYQASAKALETSSSLMKTIMNLSN